jgi:Ca2+-dependent lipid-binding protein
MDPYVQVTSKGKKYVTKVHDDGGLKPVWNHTIKVEIESFSDPIDIACLDEDLGKDDLVGETTIQAKDLLK